MLVAAEYPLLNIIWTMLVFFGFVIWFGLLFRALGDLFRRDDVSGWGKTGWTLLMLFLPLFGVLLYLGTQGKDMVKREKQVVEEAQSQFDEHVREVAANDPTSQIAKAKELLDSGAIDPAEFDRIKQKALG